MTNNNDSAGHERGMDHEQDCTCDDPKPLEMGPRQPEYVDYRYRCSRCGAIADHHVDAEADDT